MREIGGQARVEEPAQRADEALGAGLPQPLALHSVRDSDHREPGGVPGGDSRGTVGERDGAPASHAEVTAGCQEDIRRGPGAQALFLHRVGVDPGLEQRRQARELEQRRGIGAR